jgi:hypothetical protein
MHFSTFTHVRQTCFANNFFKNCFQRIWNQYEILHFFLPFLILKKEIGHIGSFYKFWSQTRQKWRQKSKNVFSKCVLDLKVAPNKGSVFLIFFKKVKFAVPYCTLYSRNEIPHYMMISPKKKAPFKPWIHQWI